MNLSRHINVLMTTVLSASISLTPLAGVSIAHAQNAPAAEAPGDSGWQKEFDAWRTASKAGTAADYQAYLRTYPTGKFASVAKKRIDELSGTKTADTTKVDKQQTADTAQADTTAVRSADTTADDAETKRDLEMWRDVSKTGKQADYEKYLKAFPKGKFAKVAKTRIDAMIAAAKAPADQKTADAKQTQQDDQNQADDQQNQADNNSQVTDQADQQDQAQNQQNSQADDQAQTTSSDWEQEYALWKAASDGNTVQEYEAYLKTYPKGKFAAIAQARIVQLAAAEQPATNVNEGDDQQAEQNNKVKKNQQADDQNQQADDQNQQSDDQNQQADDQSQQSDDQNQQADDQSQGQDDQNQTADNQMDDQQQQQQSDLGQKVHNNKPQIQYTEGTPDTEDQFLNREGRHEIQGRLTSLGYDTFGSDGSFGPNTRTAVSNWQQDNGAPVSGYLSGDQIAQIRIQSQVSYAQWLNSQVVVQRPVVVVRPRREKVIVEERHPGLDAAIAVGVLGAVVGAHKFGKMGKMKNRPGKMNFITKFNFGGCKKKRRC